MLSPRRSPGDSAWGVRALAEIDYGIVVVNWMHEVVFCNPIATRYLSAGRGLQLQGQRLVATLAQEQLRLDQALEAVLTRGHRKMLVLGGKEQRIGVAAVPLVERQDAAETSAPPLADSEATTSCALLTLSRRRLCEPLSLYAFARDHGLSPKEGQVLLGLCHGLRPQDIADEHGCSLHTVRAQVMSVRAKTGFDSINDLVNWISTLPPMLGALAQETQ